MPDMSDSAWLAIKSKTQKSESTGDATSVEPSQTDVDNLLVTVSASLSEQNNTTKMQKRKCRLCQLNRDVTLQTQKKNYSTHVSVLCGRSGIASRNLAICLYVLLARFQALLRAHRCCLSVSSLRSVLNFHSVGTSLMRNFDIYFSQRWSFLFLDTRMTQR